MPSHTNLGTDKDVEQWARAARRAGWDVYLRKTGKTHIVWHSPPSEEHPNGERLVSGLTFKDKRRIKKIRKFLTERGVQL